MASREDEDRFLRVWTPIILRASVLLSAVLLIIGLAVMAVTAPGFYVDRIHELRIEGRRAASEDWKALTVQAFHGHPRAILMFGMLLLTLVPLGRVAFTFFFFLKQGDLPFTLLTATVLLLLIVGMIVGRVG